MSDMSLVPEAAWREAQRRAEVIRPLAERDSRPRHLVQAAAATEQRELVRHYTLSAADLAAVRRCRGDHNRLGHALTSLTG